jgi:ABC-type transport system involved in multi-copper enzyme maturation permease subunit
MERLELLDPVLTKEVYGISRRGQTYAGRVLYVGVIALILYEFWTINIARSPLLSPSAYAALGRKLFEQFVPFQMIMVTLAAIGASADRIIREDAAGTLGLLMLTPLSVKRVVLSKWKASMAQAGSLILCGIPVVAVCVYLGSVGPWDLLWAFSLTGAVALLASAFGLRASAVCSTIPRALVMALLYMLGYALLPLALVFVGGFAAIFVAPFVHPAYSAWALLTNFGKDSDIMRFAWVPSTFASFFVARWIVVRAAKLVEKRVQSPIQRTLAQDADDPAPPAGFRPLKKLKEKPERKSREVWDRDPLLWKELLTRAGNRWTHESKTLFLIYFLIFILLCWLFTRGMSLGTFAFLGSLFAVLATINGAALFAPEKEGRKMDMLLSTPISSASMVRSKLMAGVGSPEAIRVGLLGLATSVAFSWWTGPGVILYAAVFLLFISFVFVLAATASLHAATLQGAALACTGILCGLLLVLPIIVSIIAPPLASGRPLSVPAWLLSSFNPIWVLEPLDARATGSTSIDALGRFLPFAVIYGSATAILVGVMHWRFDRVMGRA